MDCLIGFLGKKGEGAGSMMGDSLRKWWMSDYMVGNCKQKFFAILQKIYAFDEWHLGPINFKPYAREVVLMIEKYMNKNKIQFIVEVGCGLGDVIGNIKTASNKKCQKIGIDKDGNVIKAAKLLHPSITFWQGSFDRCINKDGVCLIMINFIHAIPKEELKEEMKRLLLANRVDLVVIDTFSRNKNTEYLYSHCGEELFDGKYRCIRKSKAFPAAHGAKRYIEYWERIDKMI